MALSLFDHDTLRHFRSEFGEQGMFEHSIGGDFANSGWRFRNLDRPLHLIATIDLAEPLLPNLGRMQQKIPLLFGFHYYSRDGEFLYKLNDDQTVELLSPGKVEYNLDSSIPDTFPASPIFFDRVEYDNSNAVDALKLQCVFGMDGLDESELDRAIAIGMSDQTYVCYSRDEPPASEWTDKEILLYLGRSPFIQGEPCKSCSNPACTADIAYHMEADKFEIETEDGPMTIESGGYDVRVPTMLVVAICELELFPFVQLVFQTCTVCGCFRASDQCT